MTRQWVSGAATATPTAAPTPLSGVSNLEPVIVDFDKAANGTTLEAGLYIKDEWLPLGLTLSAKGGVGNLPCLFDTTNPGDTNCGDPDLGALNEDCPGGRPGTGLGGRPNAPRANCDPLGLTLIVQEPGADCPDDNGDSTLNIILDSRSSFH